MFLSLQHFDNCSLSVAGIWLKVRPVFTLSWFSARLSFFVLWVCYFAAFAALHSQLVYQNIFKLKCGCKNNAPKASIFSSAPKSWAGLGWLGEKGCWVLGKQLNAWHLSSSSNNNNNNNNNVALGWHLVARCRNFPDSRMQFVSASKFMQRLLATVCSCHQSYICVCVCATVCPISQ